MDTDVDENGQPIRDNEPKVSKLTGKRRKGKPRAITPTKMEHTCRTIRAGNYVKQSVIANGCNYNTFMDYMHKGKKGIRPYDEYYEMVEQAKAGAEIDMSNRITESAENGNVGADMWKLQRMFPNRWASTQRIEQKVDNTQKIELVRFSDKHKEE
jgi:hypothetical protein